MISEVISNLLRNLNENGLAYSIVCVLSAWLGKVLSSRIARREDAAINEKITKLEASLKSTQSKLDGQIATAVHVHRVQFEKEFMVYQQIMKDVNRVRRAFHTLHPALKKVFTSEQDKHDYCLPLRKEFSDAYICARETIVDNEPFVPKDIYSHCDKFIDLSVDEISNLSCGPGEGVLSWQDQEKMKKEFAGTIKDIVTAIRNRISSISFIE